MYKITINREGSIDTHTSNDIDGCLYYLKGYAGIYDYEPEFDNSVIKSIHIIEEIDVSESSDAGIV